MNSNSNKGFIAVPLLLVLAVVIAVGGYLYFRGGGVFRTASEERAFQLELEEIASQGTSDEPEAIEADLEATSYTEIDSDLLELESELNAALEE